MSGDAAGEVTYRTLYAAGAGFVGGAFVADAISYTVGFGMLIIGVVYEGYRRSQQPEDDNAE